VGKTGGKTPIDIVNTGVKPYELYILNPYNDVAKVKLAYMADEWTVVKTEEYDVNPNDVKTIIVDGFWPRIRVESDKSVYILVLRR